MTYASQGHRAHTFQEPLLSSRLVDDFNGPSALARLLYAFQISAAFNPVSHQVHVHQTPQGKSLRVAQPRALVVPAGVELKTFGDQVVVDGQTQPTETKSGLLLPLEYTEKVAGFDEEFKVEQGIQAGTVKSIGPGLRMADGTLAQMPEVKFGQKVLISAGVGNRLQQEDEDEPQGEGTLLIVGARDIIAVSGESDGTTYRFNNYNLPGPLQALSDMVLLKELPKEDEKEDSLVLSVKGGRTEKEAVVVSVGPGRVNSQTGKLEPCPCKVGDIVLLPQTGEVCTYQGEDHIFVRAGALLGSFEGGDISRASFRPFGDRVMVELAMLASETISGLAVAVSEDTESNQGEVLAVGPGTDSVQPGQSVLFKAKRAKAIEVKGKRFKLGSERDVLSTW